MLRSHRCRYLSVSRSRASSASFSAPKNLPRVSRLIVGDTQNVITNSPCASLRNPLASAMGISGSRRFATSTSPSRSATKRCPGPPACTVLIRSLGSTSPKVFKVVKWLPAICPMPMGLGVRLNEDGVTSYAVEIRHDPTHAGARVAGGAPLAGRVGDFLLLDEGEILRTLAVLVATMAGDRVHDVGKHVRFETFVLEVPPLPSNPLVQAGAARHPVDRS